MTPPAPPRSSFLRRLGNILVIVFLLGLAIWLYDPRLLSFGSASPAICTAVPAWLELSDPYFLLLMVLGLIIWAVTRSRAGFAIFIVGLVLGITPWIINETAAPCTPPATSADY